MSRSLIRPLLAVPPALPLAMFALASAVLLAVASPFSAAGQVAVALRGGVSLASLASDGTMEGFDGSRRGLVAGASLTVPVGQHFGIRAEGRFAQKGATGNVALEEVGTADVVVELAYVELSALFQATVSPGAPVSLHFLAGPTAGYQTECKIAAEIQGTSVSVDCGNAIGTADWDFGVAAGAGVEFGVFAGLRLGAEALYTLGLSQLTEDPADLRSRALLLQAGLVVPLG